MKFSFKTLSMFLAGAAVTLTACSSEEPISGGQDREEGVGIGYMAFTISTDQSRSRGDSEFGSDITGGDDVKVGDEIFNDGNANEYAICPNTKANLAIFFTKDGANTQVFGASYLTPFDHLTDANHPGSDDDSHNGTIGDNDAKYPEQFYTYVTRWNNNDNAKPDLVLVLLNMNPSDLIKIQDAAEAITEDQDALSIILKLTEATANYGIYNYSSTDYFSMSNSTYIGETGIECATPVNGQVYATPEEALENKVVVYVERMLAKFELTFKENKEVLTSTSKKGILIDPKTTTGENVAKLNYVAEYTGKEDNLDFPEYTPVSWRVFVGNWGINGVEPKNYYFKQVQDQNYFGSIAGWNASKLHRSYWAESANYSETEMFPTQYRPTKNEDGGNSTLNSNFGIANPNSYATGNGQTNTDGSYKETTLTYYSFNHFTQRGVYKYAPERTYNAQAGLKGYGPYRFASHYLVGAQLILWDDNTDKPLDPKSRDNGNLYMDNVKDLWAAYNYYFGDEKSYIRYAYHRMVSQFADGREHTLKAENTTKIYKTKGDKAVLYTDKDMTNPLSVENAPDYFRTVMAYEKHGDGKRMIALKDNDHTLYYKKVVKQNEGTDQEVEVDVAVELTDEDFNIIAFNLTESARHFFEGKMYYAIPVQHNFGRSTASRVSVEKDTESYAVGQFGTVRNHWYVLNIKSIGNVGTPVDDPEQPIIPDPEDYYNIALEIVVLPWHKIDNGSVGL